MGNALSSTQPDEAQLDKPKISNGNDGLQLVLRTLATVKELIRRVEKEIDRRDKRYSFLGNILTAAVLLEDHLHAIEDAGKLQLFETQIGNLADLLDELFDDTVINLAQGKVSASCSHYSLELKVDSSLLVHPIFDFVPYRKFFLNLPTGKHTCRKSKHVFPSSRLLILHVCKWRSACWSSPTVYRKLEKICPIWLRSGTSRCPL